MYPKLLHLRDQSSARKTQAPRSAGWSSDYPLSFSQHFQDVIALHFVESVSTEMGAFDVPLGNAQDAVLKMAFFIASYEGLQGNVVTSESAFR